MNCKDTWTWTYYVIVIWLQIRYDRFSEVPKLRGDGVYIDGCMWPITRIWLFLSNLSNHVAFVIFPKKNWHTSWNFKFFNPYRAFEIFYLKNQENHNVKYENSNISTRLIITLSPWNSLLQHTMDWDKISVSHQPQKLRG